MIDVGPHLSCLYFVYLWQLAGVFFSAALTAQNSPELHFRFINSPICTLESGINIRIRLLILKFFPGAMSLLKVAMFIDFRFKKKNLLSVEMPVTGCT